MQAELLQIAMSLKEGESIHIKEHHMIKATEGEKDSLLWDYVVPEDVDNFARKIEKNWGIEMTHRPDIQVWIMHKPKKPAGNTTLKP